VPDLTPLFWLAGFGIFVGIPLAIWKLIDIGLWLSHHLSWS